MSAGEVVWAVSLVTAVLLLPVGAFRMLAYRSGEVDHTSGMHFVAWLALALGAVALVTWLATTAFCGSACVPG